MKKNKNTILQACIAAAIMIISSCAVLPSVLAQNSQIQYVGHDTLNRLSYNENQVMAWVWQVHAGDTIQGTKDHVYDVTSPGYAVYIDIMPTANLFHPVKYVFYANDGHITTFDANSPPANFPQYTLYQTAFSTYMTTMQNKIPAPTAPAPKHAGRDNRYAILMNGGYDSGNNHIRYWNDISNIYITLTSIYGFDDENIIVLCSDGTNPAPDQDNGQSSPLDLDNDGDADIMYPCLHDTVISVFTNLAANFSGGEKLFIFTTDHGNSVSGYSTEENLWNYETLQDYEFANLLALFPETTEKLFTLEPCFSGGFLDNAIVPPGPVVGSTAANYNEYSWAMGPDYVYDTYVFHWTAAMKGQDAYGVPVDADANQDGRIDFIEAYNYAISKDTDDEHPQYGDYPEQIGATTTLWVSSPPPENVTVPIGPSECVCGRTYTFSTSATEPDNQMVFYRFDWGDGNKSEWIGPFTPGTVANCSYSWNDEGVFHVRAKAKDEIGSESAWSAPHNISVHRLPVLSFHSLASTFGHIYIGIRNSGTMNVSDMNWTLSISGLILTGRKASGSNEVLKVKQGMDLKSKFIIGFGAMTINIKLYTQGEIFEGNATATCLGVIITNMKFV